MVSGTDSHATGIRLIMMEISAATTRPITRPIEPASNVVDGVFARFSSRLFTPFSIRFAILLASDVKIIPDATAHSKNVSTGTHGGVYANIYSPLIYSYRYWSSINIPGPIKKPIKVINILSSLFSNFASAFRFDSPPVYYTPFPCSNI